ncbi:MAG: methyltransferase domain-containing protein [Nitrospirales bacterium]|nr:methyltransferase domain-containing protein [Nitrospirales bacterium]
MLKKITYRLIAPFYDRLISRLEPERKRALSFLHFTPGDRVLIVGAGTGADILYLPRDIGIEGIDASPTMLAKALRKKEALEMNHVCLSLGDAEALPYPDSSFDAVILNLIVSVVDRPERTMSEAARVLKSGGKVLVFDKFLAKGKKAGLLRTALNTVLKRVGTDINRVFEDLIEGCPLRIREESPSWGKGFFRIYLLEKPS